MPLFTAEKVYGMSLHEDGAVKIVVSGIRADFVLTARAVALAGIVIVVVPGNEVESGTDDMGAPLDTDAIEE